MKRGIGERWQRLSKKGRLIIIVLPVIVLLGVAGGMSITLKYFAENPSACGNCHIMQPYVKSYFDSNFMDSVHAEAKPEVKCKDCHQVPLVQQIKGLVAFVTGSYDIPLKRKAQEQDFCTSCHPINETVGVIRSKPEFIENPKLSYHLTAENGKTGCYDPRAAIVGCTDCHGAHKSSVNYCNQCHSFSFGAPSR